MSNEMRVVATNTCGFLNSKGTEMNLVGIANRQLMKRQS